MTKKKDKSTKKKSGDPGLTVSEQADLDHQAHVATQLELRDLADSRNLGKIRQMIAASAEACERIPVPPPFQLRESTTKPLAEPVLLLSDWHIGDVVRAEETEGFGEFNWEIAQQRVAYLYAEFMQYIRGQRSLYHIPNLSIFVLGDLVSGGIHDELRTNEEWPPPVQACNAGKLLARIVGDLGKHFEKVHTTFIGADNHSRITQKPRCKGKAMWSWSYVVDEMFRATLPDASERFIVDSPEAMQAIVDVQGTRFLVMHGDTIKSWCNIPYYGLDRRVAQEAVRRMGTDKEFDIMVLGHFHTPIVLPRLIMNGALQGTTEYDFSCGRYGRASQVSFLVHPEHGVYNHTQWWL